MHRRVEKSAPKRKAPVGALPSDEALVLVASRFRALGDPARLRILRVLMGGEASVTEIMHATGLPQTGVSRHLGVLRGEGMLDRRGEGNRVFYRIVDPTVIQLCAIVCDGLRDQRRDQLQALRRGVA